MERDDWRQLKARLVKASSMSLQDQITFLDNECRDQPTLLQLAKELAASNEDFRHFLEEPLFKILSRWTDESDLDPIKLPEFIGPYRILGQLGEGGMGTVYLAQQDQPMKRKVALKIMKDGLDSKEAIARFRTEYQALARLSNSHIAHIFDVGISDEQRPYFIMEYVAGKMLLEFAHVENLQLDDRIALMIQVCQGMAHAHQKGIIHRDLKPSNILAYRQEGEMMVKIIDFGIAKTISGMPLADKSLHTGRGTVLGTLAYISPEQTQGPLADVDTRADIYGLGAVLYQLLTGVSPHDQIEKLSYDKALQLIREEDPVPPSVRILKTNTARQTWYKALRGEMDWIVGKALNKDRDKRYSTVRELAADLQCYLNREPVKAGPPSVRYRLGKFVERHRIGVTVVCLLFLTLVVGGSATTYGLITAYRAQVQLREAAEVAQAQAEKFEALYVFLTDMIAAPNPYEQGRGVKVTEVLTAIESQVETRFSNPEFKITLYRTLGRTYSGLDLPDKAEGNMTHALELAKNIGLGQDETILAILTDLANFYIDQGQLEAGKQALDQFQVGRKVLNNLNHPLVLRSERIGALLLWKQGHVRQAIAAYQQLLPRQRQVLGSDHVEVMSSMRGLAILYREVGETRKAISLYETLLDSQQVIFGEDHPEVLHSRNNLANVYTSMGDYDRALALHLQVLETRRRVLGPNHQHTINSIHNIGWLFQREGKSEKAEVWLTMAVNLYGDQLGLDSSYTRNAMNNLGLTKMKLGKLQEAVEIFRKIYRKQKEMEGAEDATTLTYHHNLGHALTEAGQNAEGRQVLFETLAQRIHVFGIGSRPALNTQFQLGRNALAGNDFLLAAKQFRQAWTETESNLPDAKSRALLYCGYLGFALILGGQREEGASYLTTSYEASDLDESDRNEIGLLLEKAGIPKR